MFLPTNCINCNKTGRSLCNECLQNCQPKNELRCSTCEKTSISGKTHSSCWSYGLPISTFTMFEYSFLVRDVIKKAKYGHKEFEALKLLAGFGIENAIENGYKICSKNIITSIPLHRSKNKTRGFNQSEIIANIAAKKLSVKHYKNVLVRKYNTKPQYSNSKKDRFDNVRDAFTLNNFYKTTKSLQGKKVVIIDDVITSGATMLAACKVLYDVGVREVSCMAIAKKYLRKSHSSNKISCYHK